MLLAGEWIEKTKTKGWIATFSLLGVGTFMA